MSSTNTATVVGVQAGDTTRLISEGWSGASWLVWLEEVARDPPKPTTNPRIMLRAMMILRTIRIFSDVDRRGVVFRFAIRNSSFSVKNQPKYTTLPFDQKN